MNEHLLKIWEKAATSLKGPLKFAKMDVTNNTKLARKFNVFSLPSMKYLMLQASQKTNGIHYKGQWTYEAIAHWGMQINPNFDRSTMMVEAIHKEHLAAR
jgi:thioredoxin-like negative regulator of GroEL